MVETAIYVLIGALTSALAFLLVLPAISRRARRLAQQRAALTAPLSATEARAERDALRARHAIEIALSERLAAESEARWAEAQIGLGRRAAEIVQRDELLAERAREIALRGAEIDRLTAGVRDRDVEIGAREMALHDITGQREAAERLAAATAQRLKESQMRFDERQAELEERIASLTRELSATRRDSDAALIAAQARAAELRRELEASEAAGERLKDQASAAEEAAREIQGLRKALAEAQERAETHEDADRLLRETIVRIGRELIEARGAARAETTVGEAAAFSEP